jgi:hypothetical protein
MDKIEEAIKEVKDNPHKLHLKDLAAKYGIVYNTLYARFRNAGLLKLLSPAKRGPKPFYENVQPSPMDYSMEARLREKDQEHKGLKSRYNDLSDVLLDTQNALANALAIMDYEPKMIEIKVHKPGPKGEGTAVALLSDVHCEEIIEGHKVNYLNEHNPDISKKRVAKFFELLLKFIRVDRAETNINNLVLWLGGDFFTNEAHDAPIAFPPITAAMFAQDMLYSGLKFLRENEPNLSIHVIGSVGNHSRMQIQRPVNQASEQEHSLEWMMYHALRDRFHGDKKIVFQLDNSYHTYAKVYDKTIRFNHGHLGWRYNDGLGGIHGPLWKAISQKWDKQIKADLTCCGHYHTYTPASRARQYIVNGSTVGASAYGMQFGFEDPIQAYFVVHDRYGIVGQRPLFVNA